MRENNKSIMILIVVFSVIVTSISGCSSYNLTADEEALVVEYAADKVLQYDNNYNYMLETTVPETTTAMEYTTPSFNNDGSNSSTNTTTTYTLNEAIGINGLQIDYSDYLIRDSYPDADSGSSEFVMKAVNGSKLLVIRLKVTNTTDNAIALNMLDKNYTFRCIIDGSKKMNAQVTLLLNAFNTYNNSIASGESKSLVLVFQAQTEYTKSIKTLNLAISDGNKSYTISLEK